MKAKFLLWIIVFIWRSPQYSCSKGWQIKTKQMEIWLKLTSLQTAAILHSTVTSTCAFMFAYSVERTIKMWTNWCILTWSWNSSLLLHPVSKLITPGINGNHHNKHLHVDYELAYKQAHIGVQARIACSVAMRAKLSGEAPRQESELALISANFTFPPQKPQKK